MFIHFARTGVGLWKATWRLSGLEQAVILLQAID